MITIGLMSMLIAVPLFSKIITPSLFNRITAVILAYSALLSFHSLSMDSLASGMGIYSGLFQVTTINLALEAFLFFVGSLLLLG